MKTNDALYNAIENGEVSVDSKIDVDVFSGPIGGYGFRTGNWNISIGGIKFKMYASVPHNIEIEEQREILVSKVKTSIRNAINKEIYINRWGEKKLRYSSQMARL